MMGILETISNDREKTRKTYLDAVASGQMSQELCAQLLQNSDSDFYKMCLEICHEDMEKYYSTIKRSLEVCSRPRSFLESTEAYMKREEGISQLQQPDSTQPTN